MTTDIYKSRGPPSQIAFQGGGTDNEEITVASYTPPRNAAPPGVQYRPAPPPVYGADGSLTLQPDQASVAVGGYGGGGVAASPSFAAPPSASGAVSQSQVSYGAPAPVAFAPATPLYASAPPGQLTTTATSSNALTRTEPAEEEHDLTRLTQSAPPGRQPFQTMNDATVPAVQGGTKNGKNHKTYPVEVEKMKIRRKRATIAAGVAGGVAGLVVLGPVGAVLGGAGGAAATRAIGKRKERKKREKIALSKIEEAKRNAPEVLVHSGQGEML